jgi:hypothetical protein
MVLADVVYYDEDGDKCIRRDNGDGTYNVLVERSNGSRYVLKQNVSYNTSANSQALTRTGNNGAVVAMFSRSSGSTSSGSYSSSTMIIMFRSNTSSASSSSNMNGLARLMDNMLLGDLTVR